MPVHGRSFVYRPPLLRFPGQRETTGTGDQTLVLTPAHLQWQAQTLLQVGRISMQPAKVQWQAQALRRAGARTRSYPLGLQRGYPRREVVFAY